MEEERDELSCCKNYSIVSRYDSPFTSRLVALSATILTSIPWTGVIKCFYIVFSISIGENVMALPRWDNAIE